jgi:hypothetical protein
MFEEPRNKLMILDFIDILFLECTLSLSSWQSGSLIDILMGAVVGLVRGRSRGRGLLVHHVVVGRHDVDAETVFRVEMKFEDC